MNETLPQIEKAVRRDGGVLLYEDEAVFQQAGTLARTWAPVGQGTEMKSEPCRDSVKAFGAINVKPAYSPELNATEYVWRTTKRSATHNIHFPTQRKTALSVVSSIQPLPRQSGSPSIDRPHLCSFNMQE